ncbi:PREDICTED: uncharacterized protein LOC106810891 [Priapulus caudatus]|uniref:Uncharacterized protein LOC106810891 n=1 Tax=Priapulus caudatus TaxID=37621 RepID=A0ABM1ECC8_PRICU|nr:PREDICTED: uncharacterized protein LOC106810891 [Priapulus caudatus]
MDTRKELDDLFMSNTSTNKQNWRKVAEELGKQGHIYTRDDCYNKFRAMKSKYKAIIDGNRKTGNARQTWQYFCHFDNLFGGDPAVSPIAAVSSMTPQEVSPVQGTDTASNTSSPSAASTPRQSKKRRRGPDYDEPPLWVQSYRDDQQRFHEERMELERRRVAALERLVAVLENASNPN